jgi:hypothetical protein
MSRNPRPLESLLLPLKPESLQFVYSPVVDDLLMIDVYTDLCNMNRQRKREGIRKKDALLLL